MLKVLEGSKERNSDDVVGPTLDDVAREGARRMIAEALKVEVDDYLARHREARDPATGHALVVGNGKAKPRRVTTGVGTFAVQAPRVNDQRIDDNGDRMRFRSKILPPYLRRSAKVTEVLPIPCCPENGRGVVGHSKALKSDHSTAKQAAKLARAILST